MKRLSLILIVLAVLVTTTGCAGAVATLEGKTGEVPKATITPVPTKTPTPSQEPTYTPTPSPTTSPTVTMTPTVTITPTPTDDGRVWDVGQTFEFLIYVGSHIVGDPYYLEEDVRIKEAVPNYKKCIVYGPEVGGCDFDNDYAVTKMFLEAGISPSYWCEWAAVNTEKDLGRHGMWPNGDIVEIYDRQTLVDYVNSVLGDPNREPYCPQFDALAAED